MLELREKSAKEQSNFQDTGGEKATDQVETQTVGMMNNTYKLYEAKTSIDERQDKASQESLIHSINIAPYNLRWNLY